MSIDKLHDRVRRLKSPVVLDMTTLPNDMPPKLLQEEGSYCNASNRFCRELMSALKETVCAVRFSFDQYALMGSVGLETLSQLMNAASQAGYYVFLDSPQTLSPAAAEQTAQAIFGSKDYPCDALIISPYIGSDAIKPFLSYCAEGNKAVFPIVRAANKSASELQDLLSGSRQVHIAAADIVNRLGEISYGKCGYSRVGALASATAANSLKNLRANYKRLYLLWTVWTTPAPMPRIAVPHLTGLDTALLLSHPEASSVPGRSLKIADGTMRNGRWKRRLR